MLKMRLINLLGRFKKRRVLSLDRLKSNLIQTHAGVTMILMIVHISVIFLEEIGRFICPKYLFLNTTGKLTDLKSLGWISHFSLDTVVGYWQFQTCLIAENIDISKSNKSVCIWPVYAWCCGAADLKSKWKKGYWLSGCSGVLLFYMESCILACLFISFYFKLITAMWSRLSNTSLGYKTCQIMSKQSKYAHIILSRPLPHVTGKYFTLIYPQIIKWRSLWN